ncbi:MAG: hypothetical protein WD557_10030 [Dehalococcoidia bacterium]
MPRKPAYSPEARRKLDRLTALSINRPRMVAFAAELVATEKDPFVLRSALAALDGEALPTHRTKFLARYRELARSGPKGDPGAGLRIGLLKALRPLLRDDDLPLLEEALNTYEYIPGPGPPSESAQGLRAEALLAMADRDPTRAAYQAVRLLVDDGNTDRYNGEPAVTAARLMSAMDTPLALYLYLVRQLGTIAEVTVECIKGLRSTPAPELKTIFEAYGHQDDGFIVVGCIELALDHAPSPETDAFLAKKLRTDRTDIYNYAVTAMVASHRSELLAMVLDTVDAEHDAAKLAILAEALKLADTEPAVRDAIKRVREKLIAREGQSR